LTAPGTDRPGVYAGRWASALLVRTDIADLPLRPGAPGPDLPPRLSRWVNSATTGGSPRWSAAGGRTTSVGAGTVVWSDGSMDTTEPRPERSTVITGEHGVPLTVSAPEGAPRGGIVVVQEAYGVNEHIAAVTRSLAAQGYLA